MSFQELDLHPLLKKAIETMGYEKPTPVQEKVIPEILEKKDLLVSAQTGTGKTAAFLLPILNRFASKDHKPPHDPRVLILAPTRELALQINEEAEKYCKFLPHIKIVTIYGGIPYPVQKRKLSRPYEILIATPGRLLDHMERGRIKLSKIETFILDEADRMLDMGFIHDVEEISDNIPETRQTLLFSATLDRKILSLSENLLTDPTEIQITPDKTRHENIEQKIHNVDDLHHKNRILEHLLADETLTQAIIFTSTKSYADQLVDDLIENGHNASALHGDMNQAKRTRTINSLRKGKIRILVATDVAARGIDVPTISHVINFDLPRTPEEYVHRIGRTGRAGALGTAFSFVSKKDQYLIRDIERFTGQKLEPTVIPGFESREKEKTSSRRGRSSFNDKKSFGNRPSRRRSSSRDDNFSRNDSSKRRSSSRDDSSKRRSASRDDSFSRDDSSKRRSASRDDSFSRDDSSKRRSSSRDDKSSRDDSSKRRSSSRDDSFSRDDSSKRRSSSRDDSSKRGSSSRDDSFSRNDPLKRLSSRSDQASNRTSSRDNSSKKNLPTKGKKFQRT